MDTILLEFVELLLKWLGVFTIIVMGIGVFLIAMMVLFLVKLMWRHLRRHDYVEYIEEDDTSSSNEG